VGKGKFRLFTIGRRWKATRRSLRSQKLQLTNSDRAGERKKGGIKREKNDGCRQSILSFFNRKQGQFAVVSIGGGSQESRHGNFQKSRSPSALRGGLDRQGRIELILPQEQVGERLTSQTFCLGEKSQLAERSAKRGGETGARGRGTLNPYRELMNVCCAHSPCEKVQRVFCREPSRNA